MNKFSAQYQYIGIPCPTIEEKISLALELQKYDFFWGAWNASVSAEDLRKNLNHADNTFGIQSYSRSPFIAVKFGVKYFYFFPDPPNTFSKEELKKICFIANSAKHLVSIFSKYTK